MGFTGNTEALQSLAKERTVKTQNIEYDLETLVKKINNKIIRMNPDYQRNHRWDNVTSSRLIESLVLNIPIPTIFLSQDVDVDDDVDDDVARYSVIDGQQRLTAIHGFMSNQFSLDGLDVLEPLNGLFYSDLPPFLVRRLEERTIKCLRVDSTLDSQVKYDIFERLNSGAVELEPQELRNAIYRGAFNDMIKSIAKERYLLEAMNINPDKAEESQKVKKMAPEECVLRFFALYKNGVINLKKSFKDFLSMQMCSFNELSCEELHSMKEHFELVLTTIKTNINDNPYAKYSLVNENSLKISSKFNYSIFDALAVGVSNNILNNSLVINENRVKNFLNLFYDKDFISSIYGSTNDKSKIEYRIKRVTEVFCR